LKYATFFRRSDELGFLASLTLAITSNLFIHDYLPSRWLCITVNAISFIMSLYILYNFYEIIVGRQTHGRSCHLYLYEGIQVETGTLKTFCKQKYQSSDGLKEAAGKGAL
jgi:hypothetical protein